MKRYLVLALFCVSTCGVYAQVTDATVCDVLKSPQSFDGKMVRIKGTVAVSFDQFVIHNDDCGKDVNGIWLSYPQGSKAKSGPSAMIAMEPAHNFGGTATAPTRTPVTLDKSKDFKQFDNLLSQQHNKGTGMCLGCFQNQVNATVTGRIDGMASVSLKRDASGKLVSLGGFGNMNAYPARLVIQSVADVSAKPEDYAKVDSLSQADSKDSQNAPQQPAAGSGDPLAALQKMVTGLGSSPLGPQLQKAVEVFPKPKEQNGVVIAYGAVSEVAANSGAPGTQDSPDGVLFVCTFNKDRVKDEMMGPALVHLGQHVADLRTPLKGNEDAPPFTLENNAWVVSVETGMALGNKFVTLPGGYLMWNSKWPQAEQVTNMGAALNSFLNTEEMMSQ